MGKAEVEVEVGKEGQEERTPRVPFLASPALEAGEPAGVVELQAPAPKAVVPQALLSY